jgi:hypothetical protein
MHSDVWRKRLITVALSLFLAWHTLATVIAPAPDAGPVVQAFRGVLAPYLTLFRLDNKWNFYAPNVGRGHQLRYTIEDAARQRHAFVPTDELSWYHPTYWWFRAWYDTIIDDPEEHGERIAAVLCRKHAALKPVAVTLQKLEEEDFSPADHLAGKHPLDPEFVSVSTLKRVQCSAP